MQCILSTHWFRLIVLIVMTSLAAGCGTGNGEDPVIDSNASATSAQLRLVFEDDFGGPNASPRLASKEALNADRWRAVSGYGPDNDGWYNDEYQLYQNSIDNLYTEAGNLVIEARCDTAPACNKRDGSITSARITTKDRFEIKYGNIQARIKVPGGDGIWPAFWMLGKNWPETNWPETGEIDIMEMLYGSSDRYTSHFTLHWADANGAPASTNSTFVSDVPLTDDFHVYEVDWNESRIIGKIDGVTYFTRAIDGDMSEFDNQFFLLLNVAVGGAGGSPTSTTTWPQQMLVDWVRVYEHPPATAASLTSESGANLNYTRIIQSQEFGGNTVTASLNSTAVNALEGSKVLQVNYSNTKTGNPGGPNAGYGGIFFNFPATDLSSFTHLIFSVDTSKFPGFDDLTIEFKDILEKTVQIKLSDYAPPVAESGNWKTYRIPLSAFAGVDVGRMLFIGFLNPVDDADQLLSGTLYLDDIRFTTEACTPNPEVAFDLMNYNPASTVAKLSVSDECAANKLAVIKVETATSEISVGIDLDAAGDGEKYINLVSPVSVCPASDENATVALSGSIIATYSNTYRDPSGNEQTYDATTTAGIDSNAAITDYEGERFYIYTSIPGQALGYTPDVDFQYSDFSSGSIFNGNYTGDATYSPVFSVSDLAGQAAVLAHFGFSAGFTADKKSLNFKVKNMPGNEVLVKFGDADADYSVDLTSYSGVTPLADGWYEVKIPMTEFPGVDNYTYLVIKSNTSSSTDFTFLVTDIYLEGQTGNIGAECAAPGVSAPIPAQDPSKVISMFSNTYGNNVSVDTWSAGFDTAELTDVQIGTDDIKRYALGFAGIETVTAAIDASAMTHFRMDVWTADVSSLLVKWVDFGGDGYGGANADTEGAVTLPITKGQWVSLDIPLTSFTAAGLTPSVDNLSQLILEAVGGSGTIYVDNVYFYNGVSDELITNGGFESGDLTGWNIALGGGSGASIDADNTQDSGSTWSAHVVAGAGNNPSMSQPNLAIGEINAGDTVYISFDMCGTVANGGIVFPAFLSEWGFNAGSDRQTLATITSLPSVWTRYNYSAVAGSNVSGGISLQLDVVCGGVSGCSADVYFDNVSMSIGGALPAGSASGNACTSGGGGGGSAPTTAAPTPNDYGVISIFSDAYTDITGVDYNPNWGQATVVTTESIAGNATLKYAGLNYQGTDFSGNAQDVSGTDTLHVDFWTSDASAVNLSLISPGPSETAYSLPVSTGSWVSVDIPLSSFTGVDLTSVIQLKFDDAATGEGATIYLDNIYFYDSTALPPTTPPTAAPTPTDTSTISIFSDAYTDITGVDYNPNWGQATVVTTESIAGNATLKYAGLNYQGTDFSGNAQDVSGTDTLHVDFWSPDASAVNLSLISPGPVETAYALPVSTGSWVSIDIPLSNFTGVDLTSVIQLKFDDATTGEAATIFLDNIYFYTASGGGSGGELAINGDFELGDLSGWTLFPPGGCSTCITADNTQNNTTSGAWSGKLLATGSASAGQDVVFKQANLAAGSLNTGDVINISFDMYGSVAGAGGVVFAEAFSEISGGGATNAQILSGGPIFPTGSWVNYNYTYTAGSDISGGFTLQLKAGCGAVDGCVVEAYFDNVSITVQ